MYTVDLYLRVRLACHVDGLSQREAASRFGIARETVRKMLRHSEPPGYRRRQPPKRPKLAPFTDIIDRILEEDRPVHRKQHHTAKRIFERLRDEHGFTGKETIVKDYVRERRLRRREMFVPLSHPPGHAQADFGEADAIIAGVKYRAHFFVMTLPHSDACFVAAYPAATTEAWLDGHNRAFVFFGGVPQSILYDNDKCLVSRILPDGTRQRTRAFSGLQSHYLFEDRYGRPGKGNDKGNVEGVVGYARRNFMTPLPRFASWDAFNGHLEEQCRNRQGNVLRGHRESIGERFVRDREALKRPLPAPFDACDKQGTRVNSLSLVRYRTNDYSVPVAYGHQEVWIRGYVHEVVIGCGAGIIARHPRSYDREDMVFDPIHYLPLLEHKIGALDQAAPLAGWELPDAFPTLRRLLEARMGKAGKREYVQVLRLVETFDLEVLHGAVKDALRLGAIGYDAVKHLVLCRIERRPPKLDLDIYPYLPRANVATTAAASYMSLLGGGGRCPKCCWPRAPQDPETADVHDARMARQAGPLKCATEGISDDAVWLASEASWNFRPWRRRSAADQRPGSPPSQKPRQLRLGHRIAQQDAGSRSWRDANTSERRRLSSASAEQRRTGKTQDAPSVSWSGRPAKRGSVGFLTAARPGPMN